MRLKSSISVAILSIFLVGSLLLSLNTVNRRKSLNEERMFVTENDINLNYNYFQEYNTDESKVIKYLCSQNIILNKLPPMDSIPLKESSKTLKPGEIPSYVFQYAPLVHLYTEETYLPYNIEDYVKHFSLKDRKNNTYVDSLTLNQLSRITDRTSSDLFLTTKDFIEDGDDPDWLTGIKNIPDLSTGKIKDAPATLIVVDKGNGWVDAYWFYFYSFNLGPFVMGVGPYGNHYGDWEHSLTRFYQGIPVYIWMSAHGGGNAYHYEALEKFDGDNARPLIFSSRGTHANYAQIGRHSHDLPWGILSDFTDKGSLWDPAENYFGYTWDGKNITIIDSKSKNKVDYRELKINKDWLLFKGKWGDDKLPDWDPRQKWSIFEWKYIEGPTGPLTKNLQRLKLCQTKKWFHLWGNPCPAKNFLNDINQGQRDYGYGRCGNLFKWVKWRALRTILNYLTWNGGICLFMDRVFG
ncbi:hypothetical protein WICMUC_002036 [Wickerhamomyces mucosus]|uniref:Vacuolar protein sorting-associated protein 62 n=1 Tax=Wickerhamomyces mucosus TaxID=1378264 RepID=A0A9P8PRM4_9ASCO|nr:hypothetical protein WICMUC_002036 [Wickerhamomyces mucosus]